MIGHHRNGGTPMKFEKIEVFKPGDIVDGGSPTYKSVTNLLQFTKKHSCPEIEAESYDEEKVGKTLYSCVKQSN